MDRATYNLADATRLIDRQVDAHMQAIDSLKELKKSLTHDSQKVINDSATGIQLNQMELAIFKRLHALAIRDHKDRLEFKGHVILTDYAGYVIEYMETKFDDARR